MPSLCCRIALCVRRVALYPVVGLPDRPQEPLDLRRMACDPGVPADEDGVRVLAALHGQDAHAVAQPLPDRAQGRFGRDEGIDTAVAEGLDAVGSADVDEGHPAEALAALRGVPAQVELADGVPGHPNPLSPEIRCGLHPPVPPAGQEDQLRPRDAADSGQAPAAERALDEGELVREGEIGLAELNPGGSGQARSRTPAGSRSAPAARNSPGRRPPRPARRRGAGVPRASRGSRAAGPVAMVCVMYPIPTPARAMTRMRRVKATGGPSNPNFTGFPRRRCPARPGRFPGPPAERRFRSTGVGRHPLQRLRSPMAAAILISRSGHR